MNIDNEFAWRSELRKLGGEAEPQSDLWPQIAARIAVRPALLRWRMGLGLAVSLIVAFGIATLAWRTQSTNTLPMAAHTATVISADNAPLAWAVPADPALAAASRDLDSASVQLQQALETHPQAVFLVGLLNRTNARRMRLLRQMPSA